MRRDLLTLRVRGAHAPWRGRSCSSRGSSPTPRPRGRSGWGLAGIEAARSHEEALEVLLHIATREVHLARLGEEIQETSRRVNALEQLLLPALGAETARLEAALDERDREDAVRLKRLRHKRARR